MALQSSADQPVPVRTVAQLVAGWIGRLGTVWVEGQVAQVSVRPGAGTVFLTLRDTAAAVSLPVTCPRRVLEEAQPPVTEGTRVVVQAQPTFFVARGSFSLQARQIRHVGLGELLARLERLKGMLAAEGLFAPERKQPLPFLPHTVGLVCGRASAAERDVVDNARSRWPAVRFRVLPVAVQGPTAASQVSDALRTLDADPEVDVIVIARGGGSVEDLLPFSEEPLLRAVAACATPVVSAIGHEQDSPLLDLVADVRASTPTDAARCVVPDVGAEIRLLGQAQLRLRRALVALIDDQSRRCADHRLRVRRGIVHRLDREHDALDHARARVRGAIKTRLDREREAVGHNLARLRSLSPQATLDRGYAVVQLRPGGQVVRSPAQVEVGDALEVRVAGGTFDVDVAAVSSPDSATQSTHADQEVPHG